MHVNPKIPNSIMQDYDNLEVIIASNEWEEQLFSRIENSRKNYVKNKELLRYTLYLVVFVGLNLVLFFGDNKIRGNEEQERFMLLNNISDQLLINSTSLK